MYSIRLCYSYMYIEISWDCQLVWRLPQDGDPFENCNMLHKWLLKQPWWSFMKNHSLWPVQVLCDMNLCGRLCLVFESYFFTNVHDLSRSITNNGDHSWYDRLQMMLVNHVMAAHKQSWPHHHSLQSFSVFHERSWKNKIKLSPTRTTHEIWEIMGFC